MSKLQSVRGMHDLLGADIARQTRVEHAWIHAACAFGYEPIRVPILEPAELFRRSVGAATDIVEKEMYVFTDRGGDELALRPEGTAGTVRAAVQHGLTGTQQRLWYCGACFRHERPQQGRLRQFHQFGVETFGMEGPGIDAELILLGSHAFRTLGITPVLRINTLGDADERAQWRTKLVDYFTPHEPRFGDTDRRRLQENPLRLLDSKAPEVAELLPHAPQLDAHLGTASRAHFDALCERLDQLAIAYTRDPTLVRGLDYYDRTVFEWDGPAGGAQSALAAGGRYNRLVEQCGGKATPAAGFAVGIERVRDCCAATDAGSVLDVYLAVPGEQLATRVFAEQLAATLRAELPDLRVRVNREGGSMKAQLRRADKSGAQLALIAGDEEAAAGTVQCKPLRGGEAQQSCTQAECPSVVRTLLDLEEVAEQ